jgi:hypothetical protein
MTTLTVKRSAALAHWGSSKSANVRRHPWMRSGTSPASDQPNLRISERMKSEPCSGLTPAPAHKPYLRNKWKEAVPK